MIPPFPRRLVLALAALPAATGLAGAQPASRPTDLAEWQSFRTRFVRADGRVIDTANGGVSHSEGQGWGLLCAERAGDRAYFDLMLSWTRRVLARRQDHLFAWRFRPDGSGAGSVDDPNNATDGDLMIAWALLRAGQRWREPDYQAQGTAIARDVLRLLVRQVGDDVVLLPGLNGFEQREHIIINPSYYAFPALRALAQAVPDPLWLRVAADGLGLLRRARFGRWGLPSDWVALPRGGGRPAPAPGWPPRFSYDAVRVPLYLAWAGMAREPAAIGAARFWTDPIHPRLPAWVDLNSDATSPYLAPSGIRAISQFIALRQGEDAAVTPLPAVGEAKDYYSAVLTLLTRLAMRDSLTTST
ncbi:glycosyl hydrolase family 8 [Falsiroseomonas sp. CW058]|uniref:glycosyl hydrolase family 8 n=1 Tax=Falsiroseomonas sp. CW058 TaxID=3388664 RepID=UPI003D314E86